AAWRLMEDYRSPFDFEQGVNASYLYLSPAPGDTPPSSPAAASGGNSKEEGHSLGAGTAKAMSEEEQLELQEELIKVEDEIQTLSQVLAAKEKQLADIKRKLGITPLNELRQNISRTWQDVTASTAYRRTSETLSQASLKATAAFSSVGSVLSRKLEDVRKAPTFKNLEEKVGTLKTKMSPSSAPGPVEPPGGPASEALLPEPEGPPPQETP
uniref:Tumor protein D52 n=1 Tax=Tetraodon nigroviridis TaxID=99883 RepID=H3DK89_TETNG